MLIAFLVTANFLQGQDAIPTMLKQVALIETYIGWLEKGYSIARKGLTTIGDIKGGHWKADIEFFNSLKNVNPAVKKYTAVAAIIGQQTFIVRICHQLRGLNFNPGEISYVKAVADHLIDECTGLTDQLTMVLTDKKLQMSDDERINAIEKIYAAVYDQYSFIKAFSDQAAQLAGCREKEKHDIKFSRSIRGI
ncbi:MAG: hypothetical protein ABUT20_15470 [Bacteroidota bacterium]